MRNMIVHGELHFEFGRYRLIFDLVSNKFMSIELLKSKPGTKVGIEEKVFDLCVSLSGTSSEPFRFQVIHYPKWIEFAAIFAGGEVIVGREVTEFVFNNRQAASHFLWCTLRKSI